MVRNWQELHICGWFGSYLKDIQSELPHEARGQTWPQRSHEQKFMGIAYLWMVWELFERYSIKPPTWGQRPKLISEVTWTLCQNDNNININIKLKLPHTINKYAIWRHSNMLVKWPLRSTLASDLFSWVRASILIPNHPQVCNLKSFWHVFEVTSKVNFGLWPH